MTLTDGTIVLRPFVEADVPRVQAAFDDPAIREFMEKPQPFDADAWWTKLQVGGNFIEFAVTDAGDGTFLGRVTLWDIRNDHGEVGYWLLPEARGRGAATRAVALVTEHGLTTLGLHRIVAYVKPENPSSATVLERAGFSASEASEYPGYIGYEKS